mgnify:CR=1 FL=1
MAILPEYEWMNPHIDELEEKLKELEDQLDLCCKWKNTWRFVAIIMTISAIVCSAAPYLSQ